MAAQQRILILLHEEDRSARKRPYRIWPIADFWRERGLAVEVQHGVARRPPADLVVPHVDLTVLPDAYDEFLAHYPLVLNRAVRDVTKRVVSGALLERDDAYEGPVLVKTNRNYGGAPEYQLDMRKSLVPKWLRNALEHLGVGQAAKHDLARTRVLKPWQYPIFPSLAAVPDGVFENPALVVERYIPEREGELYAVRHYYFCGDQALCVRRLSTEPIVKGPGTARVDDAPIPEAIVSERTRLGFDWGKFDYVVHDGEATLFDANPTPSWGRGGGGRAFQERINRLLADGIHTWLPAPASGAPTP